MRAVVLKDKKNQIKRVFPLSEGEASFVVLYRQDLSRMEVVASAKPFEASDVPHEILTAQNDVSSDWSFKVLDGTLSLENMSELASQDFEKDASLGEQKGVASLAIISAILMFFVTSLIVFFPKEQIVPIEKIIEQRVVKIIKKAPPKSSATFASSRLNSDKKSKPQKISVKRRGALSVLGALKSSSVLGGVNLGQTKINKGAGLGGSAGSGGVQTSFYGKGKVARALGVGQNVKGAGGYGTQGAGGGGDGAGKQALIGSSGVSTLSLGEESLVEGGLSQDAIAAVVNRNIGQIRFCYEQALQMNPKLAGRVKMNFTIGSIGRVTVANVAFSSLNSPSAHECMVLRLKSWQFPAPAGGANVSVSYPFVFKRVGGSTL